MKFLSDFLESFWFFPIKAESRVDNPSFPIIKHLKEIANFITKILVAKHFERILRFDVADQITKSRRIVIADRLVE